MTTKYTRQITVDLNSTLPPSCVSAKQGDNATRFICATIQSNGKQYWPEGVTVTIRCEKPDGKYVENPATVNSDGTVTAELSQQMLAAPGEVTADLCLYGENGEILSTAPFTIQVEAAPEGEAVDSENEFLQLQAFIEKSRALIADYESSVAELDEISADIEKLVPVVTVTQAEGGHWLKITDQNGEQAFWVADGEQGPQGDRGPQGEQGPQGETGPAGADGTATDEQVAAWLDAHPDVTTSLQNGEVTPEKTSFIQCSYQGGTEEKAAFTNQIPVSIDTDGTVYNGTGWKANTRITSSGAEAVLEGFHVTGYIPCAAGDVVRTSSGVIVGSNDNQSLCRFDTNMTFLGRISYNAFETNGFTVSDDGALYAQQSTSVSNLGYIRIVGAGIGDDAVVTVNEEIVYTSEGTVGEATGFCLDESIQVPLAQRNETRIGALEKSVAAMNENVMPDYVRTEAERVAGLVTGVQGGSTFSFAAVSDLHYLPGAVNTPAILHAGQAVKQIGSLARLDAVAVLGDLISGGSNDTLETCRACYTYVNRVLADGCRGIPNVRLNGNHDCQPYCYDGFFTQDQIFAQVGAWNTGASVSQEDRAANYGCLDFKDRKLRLIYLNTCDIDGIYIKSQASDFTGNRIGSAQLKWLIKRLKELSGDWSVILMGHHPLEWVSNYYTDGKGIRWEQNTVNGAAILSGYVSGTAGSVWLDGEEIPYDFTDGEKAEVIAYFHGHTHNFATGAMGDAGILRIAIPNALPGRENEYTSVDGMYEEVTYPKTAGTEEDTAFFVVTVDIAGRKLYAHHYGAGYDRDISY